MAHRGGFAGGLFAIFVPSPRIPAGTDAAAAAAPSQGAGGDALPTSVLETKAARDTVLSMVSLLLRIERESQGRVRICRDVGDIQESCGPRRIGCCPSSGRRGSDRREVRTPGRSVCGRTSLDRSAVESTECLWAWGTISLPLIARYRPGPDCARQGAGGRLQPIEDPGGPVTPQRTRILGCRRHQRCAPGRRRTRTRMP